MPRARVEFLRTFATLAAAFVLTLVPRPARAGGRIVLEGKSTTPISTASSTHIEALPTTNLRTVIDAINASGKGNVISIGRGARIHSSQDAIEVDQADLITVRGRVTGGSSGIEVNGFGDDLTRILITDTGVVRGRSSDGAIDLDSNAPVDITNFGLIEGHRNLDAGGIGDLRGSLFNFGRILANGTAVATDDDTSQPDANVQIFNSGLIWGGRGGSNGHAIGMDGGTWSLGLMNGPNGWLRSGSDAAVAISPSVPTDAEFTFRNWGLVSSDLNVALGVYASTASLDVRNFGILRGGFDQGEKYPAISLNGGTLRLGGTGWYDGGVRKDENSDEFTRVVLDGVNVPLDVKKKWNGRSIDLGFGHSVSFGPRVRIVDVDQVVAEDLFSFQEYVGGGLKDAADALDNAVIPRTGMDQLFIGLLGAKRDRPGAVNRTLETFTGRSVQQAASDIAFDTETLLSNKINDYLDRSLDRRYWDSQQGVEHETPWGGFLQGLGTFAEQDPTDDRVHQDWTNYGGVAGLDYRFGDRALAGVFASYRTTEADVDGFGSHFDSNDVSVGGYGSVGPCGCGFVGTGGLWYTYHDYDGMRRFGLRAPAGLGDGFGSTSQWQGDGDHHGSKHGYDKGYDHGYGEGHYPGLSLRSRSSWQTDGHQLTAFARVAYDWRPTFDPKSVIEPFFTTQYSGLWIDGYDESGPRGLNLSVDDQQGNSLRTMFGARVSREFAVGPVHLRPEFRAEWIHESLDDGRDIDTRVNSPYIRPFQVESDVGSRDYSKVGVGLAGSMSDCGCMQLSVNYDTILGRQDLELHDVSMNFQLFF